MLLTHIFRLFLWFTTAIFGSTDVALTAKIRCYKGTVDDFDEAPIEEAQVLLKSPCYNSSRYNRFYAFGYEVAANGTDATTVINALLSLPKSNVFLVNWEKAAKGDNDSTITEVLTYPVTVVTQVSQVGIAFGNALTKMAKDGLNLNATQLIGHSLGAHLCGNAGRTLISNNLTVDRITGLDPAGPFFQFPVPIMVPLDKTCARFVDCVHTDYGVYGINASLCHRDTYFIKLKENVQPGCPVGLFPPLSKKSKCSHDRCWQLYSDGIMHPNTLIGGQATTFADWFACLGNYSNTITIDADAHESKIGNFFATPTKAVAPFGRGQSGRKPSECKD